MGVDVVAGIPHTEPVVSEEKTYGDFKLLDTDVPLDGVWKGSLVILRNFKTDDLVSGFLVSVSGKYIELSREHPDNKNKHLSTPSYKYHASFLMNMLWKIDFCRLFHCS